MDASSLLFQNIVIPVIGICILLPLMVAAYLEPGRDYSRRIYLTMLLSCAVILASEGLQIYFEGSASANGQRIIMFVFYAFLSVLCYCWTLYAYYWFSGRRPSGRAAVGFVIAPLCELAALAVNGYQGFIYAVDESGLYVRGSGFSVYIAFCYLYLILAIAVTALRARPGRRRDQRRDLLLFLLFFIFPVLGPILQYMFPMLSLMGISEAIALLIVFVSVQQKTVAQYAVEKARYEDEYSAYEKSLERLLTVSADALCVFRLNLTRNSFSGERGAAGVISGSGPETADALFETLAAAIPDGDEQRAFRSLFDRQELLATDAAHSEKRSVAYHRRVENGELHFIRAFLSMLKNPVTGDTEAIVYAVDIDRQEKEEKMISAITNREYDFIALIDAETKKIHCRYSAPNPALRFVSELGDYEAVMQKALSLFSPGQDGGALAFSAVAEALCRQEEYSCVLETRAASGQKQQKKVTYLFLDERKTEILFFISDITEETRQERERSAALQKALREARRADALKSEFLSNVSHDMRTPLNAVLGYTRLARDAADPDEAKDCLDKIDRAGNALLSLINDTLDLSKIETGKIVLRPAPTLCREITDKVMSVIVPAAYKKHIRLQFDDGGLSRDLIRADALRLQELLIHLLSNAVKFTPEYGEVSFRFSCASPDERIARYKIVVSDTGCGMRPEFLPKMYEPFAQEQQSGDVSGSGLGLSIVKKLVDMMGGRIECQSQAGRGTRFTLRLDFERAAEIPEKAATPEEMEQTLRGRRILLVEDNEMNTEIARALLEEKHMEVTCAENGQIACELFASANEGDFDAILMDIRMPVMDGREAARRIRRMQRPDAPSIPIIALSADAFDDDVQASLEAGMNAHLPKPINSGLLFETLRRQLVRAE